MTTTHRTPCAHDCPGSCALLVETDGDHLLSLRGDPAHPLTRGVICGKVRRWLGREDTSGAAASARFAHRACLVF